jgi:hypothetical protein
MGIHAALEYFCCVGSVKESPGETQRANVIVRCPGSTYFV